MAFSKEDFCQTINVSRETLERLDVYAAMLVKWQPAKNLVSNSTIEDMWRRHFLDSAQLMPLIHKAHGEKPLRILDIGSGAGFPGLVLAIMGVGDVTMVEANGRKCAFMRQVALETDTAVTISNERIESLEPKVIDIVMSRACATVLQLLHWGEPFLGDNSEFWLLKGSIADEELTNASEHWMMNVERYKSLSGETGVILRLSGVKRT